MAVVPAAAAGGSEFGKLDSPDLKPQFILLTVGVNTTYDANTPLADSVFAGASGLIDAVRAQTRQAIVVLES